MGILVAYAMLLLMAPAGPCLHVHLGPHLGVTPGMWCAWQALAKLRIYRFHPLLWGSSASIVRQLSSTSGLWCKRNLCPAMVQLVLSMCYRGCTGVCTSSVMAGNALSIKVRALVGRRSKSNNALRLADHTVREATL